LCREAASRLYSSKGEDLRGLEVTDAQQMTRNIAGDAGTTVCIIAACKDCETAPLLQTLEQTTSFLTEKWRCAARSTLLRYGNLGQVLSPDAIIPRRGGAPYPQAKGTTVMEQEEFTRMVREGVGPEGVKDRMKLFGDKLAGNAPLGVDAPNKTARKVIGAGGQLFAVLKYGFLGGMLALCGALFVYAGFQGEFQIKVVAIGGAMLGAGLWALRTAHRAWQKFRAVSRA
jgi:hypothetical protein